MILESVEHGPLIWPTIEENGMTRTKKYEELFTTKKIQANCDLKATNIIFQGLPSDAYSLVNHHRVAKNLWERIQLLMQGTSLIKQERKCKLYDAFDKFAHIKVESLHQYYLRFTQLINDMNIYKMKLEQFQVNTKFLNSLAPEWTPYPNAYSSTVHQDACPQPQSIPQIEYTVSTVNQQTHLAEFPQIDSSLAVLVFKQGDDPIDAINKMMSFLSTVITSRRSNSYAVGTSGTRANILGTRGTNSVQQRVVKCFNCQGKVTWQDSAQSQRGKGMLHNPRVAEGPVTQMVITHNVAYQADDLDAYDSDCDDISTAKAVLMANLSSYGSDVLSKFVDFEKELLTETFNVLKNESKEKEIKNIDKEIALEKKKAHQIRPMLYDGSVIAKETNVISIVDSEETLMLEDIVNIVVNSSGNMNTSVNVNSSIAMNDSVNYVENFNKCLKLEDELIKQHNMVEKDEYNRLSKSFSKLEQHCISLELAMQLNKEIFQKNNPSVNQTEPTFDHLFELNNLKAKLQAKDITIKKLMANIKRLNKTSTTNSVKKDCLW
ncbi:hypothetical protein Tco_0211611 [Tanacetum coccineum]